MFSHMGWTMENVKEHEQCIERKDYNPGVAE
jgi:hypothetical protein